MFANFDLLSCCFAFLPLFIVFVLFFFSTVLVNKDKYRMYAVQRCGLLLQMSHVAIGPSVCHKPVLYQNG